MRNEIRFIAIIFFFFFFLLSCFNSNKPDKKVNNTVIYYPTIFKNTIEPESLKKAMIYFLQRFNEKDTCDYFFGSGVLKIGDFFGNNNNCSFIVINNYKFLFFENDSSKWRLISEVPFESEYSGYELNDINGDNCLDFMLKDYYIWSNWCYRVLVSDCKKKRIKYISGFEGVMNPFYDKKTKLINSFFFTNHGDLDKETYKIVSDSLDFVERVILEGAGIEDRDSNKFKIKHFVNSNNKIQLHDSINLNNYKYATNLFDKQLFSYFYKCGVKTKLSSASGWVQLEIK